MEERIPGKHYVCSYSAGKDSTYLLYELIQRKWPLDEIRFLDTGLEFPSTYEWLDHIEKRLGIKITRYPPLHTFDEIFYRKKTKGKYAGQRIKGFPPMNCGCWVSTYLKMKQKPNGKNEIIYLGICANEAQRAVPADNKRYPMVEWGITEEQAMARLKELDLVPFYYAQGFKRNGCWVCPKQPVGSLRLLWKLYPELWARLKQYEKDSPHGFKDWTNLTKLETRWRKEDGLA